MIIETSLGIVLAIFILVIGWGLFKKIFEIVYYAGIGFVLLLIVGGFLIFNDVKDFKENFSERGNVILLENDGIVLAGYTMEENPKFFTSSQISEYSIHLQNKDYDDILADRYKLMVIDIDLITDLDTDRINLGDATLKKESMKGIFKSDEPFEDFNKAIIEDKNLLPDSDFDSKINNEDLKFKASLLGTIVDQELLGPENSITFFDQYKKGNIIIYPETSLFKIMKILPLGLVGGASKKLFEKTKDNAKAKLIKRLE